MNQCLHIQHLFRQQVVELRGCGRLGAAPARKLRRLHVGDRAALGTARRRVGRRAPRARGQLGLAAASAAMEAWPQHRDLPPSRRGMYVGGSPQAGEAEDMLPALDAVRAAGGYSLGTFATAGIPLIPPLWLVKGLSNNILGYAAAQWDLQGDNGNWCDGRLGGAVALANAVQAVAEGRVDLALAGGADVLVGAEALLGRPGSEAAAFLVLVPGAGLSAGPPEEEGGEEEGGELGAALYPLTLARRWLRGERGFSVGGVRVA